MSGNPEEPTSGIFTATVVDLGRVTIPVELRELHGIQKGHKVTLKIVSVNKKPNSTAPGKGG